MQTVQIIRIVNECEGIRTLFFKMEYHPIPEPGQFAMIWVPGIDEIPMSISLCDERGIWGITVKSVGDCTKKLHALRVGDYIGVRGPLGNCFPSPKDANKQIFIVGGGMGMAPLKFLAQKLSESEFKYTIIEGAKTDDTLVFVDEIYEITRDSNEFFCCTDDGSYGEKGTSVDAFKKIMNERENDIKNMIVYSCGPESMMYGLFLTCKALNIELYASLERIMRCGFGLCGLCSLDPIGLLVCKDGPIFNLEQLSKIKDFGKYKRDFTGKKVPLD